MRGSFAADRLDCRVHVNAAARQPLQAKRPRRAKRRGESARVLSAARGDAAHLDPLTEVRVSRTRNRALGAVIARAHVAACNLADDSFATRRSVRGKSAAPHDFVRLTACSRKLVSPGRATLHELGELLRVDANACREVLERERHLLRVRCAADVKFENSLHYRFCSASVFFPVRL